MVDTQHPDEFRERVLYEFKRLREDLLDLSDKIDHLKDGDISQMKVELGMLKVKASVWGAAGGAIPVFIALAVHYLGK